MAVAVRPSGVEDQGVRVAERPADRWTPLGTVLALLPVVALVEVALERVFYRVGVYLPRSGPFGTVYTVLTAIGSFAFNLSSVLAVVALGLMAAAAWSRDRPRVTLALGAFLVSTVVLLLAGVETLGPTARLAFVLAAAALTVPFVREAADPWHRAAVALVGASFVCSASAGLIGDGARLLWTQPIGVAGWQVAAELLVVAAAFAVFAAWIATDGLRLRPIVVAAPLAATLLVAWHMNGAVTGILVLWTAGLRLFLPMWLYALALWAFLSAAIGWLPRHPSRSGGLVLLLAAGMLLGSTYLQALGLVALALLSDGGAIGGLPSSARGSAG